MKRTALILCALVAVTVPIAIVGQALDFGGLAWLGALLVAMFIVSLVDRDYFYGTGHPR